MSKVSGETVKDIIQIGLRNCTLLTTYFRKKLQYVLNLLLFSNFPIYFLLLSKF